MAATTLTISNHALRIIGGAKITTFGETTSEEGRAINDVYDDIRDEVLGEHPWTFAQKRASLAKVITGASQESPVVITAVAHGLEDEDEVKITGIIGMTELNGNTYKIKNKEDDTFELTDPDDDSDIDGSAYTEYSSGGFARKIYTLAYDEDGLDIVYDLPSDFIHLNFTSDRSAVVKIEGTQIITNVEELKIKYTYRLETVTQYSAKFRVALATRLAAEIGFSLTESVSKAEQILKKYQTITLPEAQSGDSQQGTPNEAIQDEWEIARLGGVGAGIAGRTGQQTWHPIS